MGRVTVGMACAIGELVSNGMLHADIRGLANALDPAGRRARAQSRGAARSARRRAMRSSSTTDLTRSIGELMKDGMLGQ